MGIAAPRTPDNAVLLHELSCKIRVARLTGVELQPSDERLLQFLTPEQVEILRCEGSYVEIAQKLNIPLGTVRSRLSRARAALVQLRKEAGDPARNGLVDAKE